MHDPRAVLGDFSCSLRMLRLGFLLTMAGLEVKALAWLNNG